MILLTGANGVVGQPMLEHLRAAGNDVLCVSRSAQTLSKQARPKQASSKQMLALSEASQQLQWDLHRPATPAIIKHVSVCKSLIHCAPIWLLPKHMGTLQQAGVRRLIVFSSTSVISKTNSLDPSEQRLVRQLSSAEQALRSACSSNSMHLTIFRPSMIYGYGRDQNVMKIAQFIHRYGFMVLVGKATGLRQPVHADDLVAAVMKIIDLPCSYSRVYNLAGAERLTYRQMVERIFSALDKPIRIIPLPLWIYQIALRLAAIVTKFSYSPEMARRMAQNLSYDYKDATADFDFNPQAFLQDAKRDLPLPATNSAPSEST